MRSLLRNNSDDVEANSLLFNLCRVILVLIRLVASYSILCCYEYCRTGDNESIPHGAKRKTGTASALKGGGVGPCAQVHHCCDRHQSSKLTRQVRHQGKELTVQRLGKCCSFNRLPCGYIGMRCVYGYRGTEDRNIHKPLHTQCSESSRTCTADKQPPKSYYSRGDFYWCCVCLKFPHADTTSNIQQSRGKGRVISIHSKQAIFDVGTRTVWYKSEFACSLETRASTRANSHGFSYHAKSVSED